MEDEALTQAGQRAIEMDAARRASAPIATRLGTFGVAILAAIAVPVLWNFVFQTYGHRADELIVGVIRSAIPSALLVAALAAAVSDRWVTVASAASVGQIVGSIYASLLGSLAMDGHSHPGAYVPIFPFFAPLAIYPIAAFLGAELGLALKKRRG